MATKRE